MVLLIWVPVGLLLVAREFFGVPIPTWLLNGTAAGSFVATFVVMVLLARQRAAESPETPEEREAWWRTPW